MDPELQQRSQPYNANPGYLPNGAAGPHTALPSGVPPLLPNSGRVVQTGGVRVLCIADVRAEFELIRTGKLRTLNELAKQARADYIIHTGDFGFYDDQSLNHIAEKTLKHVVQYSPLLPDSVKKNVGTPGGPIKSRLDASDLSISELPQFLNGSLKLDVPVYTVWGACEDVRVLEKFRSGEYKVDKLHIIDEARSMLLEISGVKLRLLGLGGAVVMHKLFDNGEGRTTIAGGQGTTWTTLLQMGELVDTANRVYDPTETRIFITHASPAREGILNQLSVTLKADFSISAGLHFRYGSSYNEFSVNPTLDHYRGKLAASKASFNDVWETVKGEVQPAVAQNEAQRNLLQNALGIVDKMPSSAVGGNPFGGPVGGSNAAGIGQVDECAFKNMWNFNLADAAFGWLILEIQDGRITTEMRAQGFNFAHRGKQNPPQEAVVNTAGASGTKNTHAVAPQVAPSQQTSSPISSNPQFNQNQSRPQQQNQRAPVAPDAAPTSNATQPKSSAPAPLSNVTSNPPEKKENEKVTATNGAESSSPAVKSHAAEIIGLFIMNVTSDDAVRDLFNDEDKEKILRIEKWGQSNKVAHFKTIEERDSILASLPDDIKSRTGEDRSRPLVKVFQVRENGSKSYNNNRSSAGNWGSNRGGNPPGAGYRSGGGASDSEGARGGRGGRGGQRGGRGDRVRGRGRGFKNESSPATLNAIPAPVGDA
ncbi:Uncharacterized protein C16H5.12c [Golovinomyces cichoracearum]|uniref:Uncharacterized protein C16H5.12c n=1 Tax=Golovinomyces cichoracearum TaxID=62708 RepID=A0A420II61_9PEZI|nr:Uncharacterized protein C16H5.12c [Golovinomyces cichoracearum]